MRVAAAANAAAAGRRAAGAAGVRPHGGAAGARSSAATCRRASSSTSSSSSAAAAAATAARSAAAAASARASVSATTTTTRTSASRRLLSTQPGRQWGQSSVQTKAELGAPSRASARAAAAADAAALSTHHGQRLPASVRTRSSYGAYARHQQGGDRWGLKHWAMLLGGTVFLGWGMVRVVRQAFELDDGPGRRRPRKGEKREKVLVLGSGFAALGFAAALDSARYEVTVASPRNFFLFTPVLPQVVTGTLDASGAVEPVRRFLARFGHAENAVTFVEAEARKVDPANREVHLKTPGAQSRELVLPYDKLIIATGSAPHVPEPLKADVDKYAVRVRDIDAARSLRHRILDALETASLPGTSKEDMERLCTVVIVGGGPVSVNLASQLHNLIHYDLAKLFPHLSEHLRVVLINVGDHAKNTYDKKVSDWFSTNVLERECEHIERHTSAVIGVNEHDIRLEHDVPLHYGTLVWATQPSSTPFTDHIRSLAKDPEDQRNIHAIVTNSFLQAKGIGEGNIYAIGECATLEQTHILRKLEDLFQELDVNGDGSIDEEEFQAGILANVTKFPQLLEFAEETHELFLAYDKDGNGVLDRDEFRDLLAEVDSSLTGMPTSAQTAVQQGDYLAHALNSVLTPRQVEKIFDALDTDGSGSLDADEVLAGAKRLGLPATKKAVLQFMKDLDDDGDGSVGKDEFMTYVLANQTSDSSSPGDWKRPARNRILPFRYQHLGGFEYVGYDSQVTERGSHGSAILDGFGAWWLWRSVLFSSILSDQNRAKLAFGGLQFSIFGREFTRS